MNAYKKIARFTLIFAFSICFFSCQSSTSQAVEKVCFSPSGGYVSSAQEINLSCSTSGAQIYYSSKKLYSLNYQKNGINSSSFTLSSLFSDLSESESFTVYAIAVSSSGEYFSASSSAVFYLDSSSGENGALYFGNPSNAVCDSSQKENYLINRSTYSLSYNENDHIPNWVAWHLDSDDLGDVSRSSEFFEDTSLPSDFTVISPSDYQYSTYGFDRGHMCPSGDRTDTTENNESTFFMTNMVPQSPNNNQKVWMYLENYERSLALSGYELYIICGPSKESGGTSAKGTYSEITVDSKNTSIRVPSYTWKIILILPQEDDDLSRVENGEAKVLAVSIPNTTDCLSNATSNSYSEEESWKYYIKTVDEIESETDFDFFALLPDEIENALESTAYSE